jgi:hypothetical protein
MKEEEASSNQASRYGERHHRKLHTATTRPASGFVD